MATREDEPGDEEEIFTAQEGKDKEDPRERRGGRGKKTEQSEEKPNAHPSGLS